MDLSEYYSHDEISKANATARSHGAVGSRPICIPIVLKLAKKEHKILDYGAGPDAIQTLRLREKGLNVTAHDFGDNVTVLHDPDALKRKYDIIFASNVLNVQSSYFALSRTLQEIYNCLKADGLFICNYPAEPRKLKSLTETKLERYLKKGFVIKHHYRVYVLVKKPGAEI